MNLSAIIPGFLKRLDKFLLLNHPFIWRTRVHYIAFFSLIVGNLIAFGLATLYPVAVTNVPSVQKVTQLFGASLLIALFGILFWGYTQYKFRIRDLSWKAVCVTLVVYFAGMLSLSTNVYVFNNTLINRIANVVPDYEFYSDYEFMEDNYYFRHYDSNDNFLAGSTWEHERLTEIVTRYGFTLDNFNFPRLRHRMYGYNHGPLKKAMFSIGKAKLYKKSLGVIPMRGRYGDLNEMLSGLTFIGLVGLPVLFTLLSFASLPTIFGFALLHFILLLSSVFIREQYYVEIDELYIGYMVVSGVVALVMLKNTRLARLASWLQITMIPIGLVVIGLLEMGSIYPEDLFYLFSVAAGGLVLTLLSAKLMIHRLTQPASQ